MPWMVPETKLDTNQRHFLQRFDRDSAENYWLKGFAGSGKSVLILHAAIRAQNDNPDMRICMVLYTHSLIDLFRTGMPEELPDIPILTYHQFRKRPQHYNLILVDEVQDLPENILSLLEKYSERLIVAGDEAQSIYSNRVTADDIPRVARTKPYALTVLHRLTKKVIEISTKIFPEKQLETAKKSRLKNVDVELAYAEKEEDEVAYVWKQAVENARPGKPVAILIPRRKMITRFANMVLSQEGRPEWVPTKNRWDKEDFEAMNAHLKREGLKLRYIGNRNGALAETENVGTVILMTYHSAKGLDFESVFLPFLNEKLTIWYGDDERARTLFYVAVTRSRLNLFLSYTGRPHRFVSCIPERLLRKVNLPLPKEQTVVDDEPEFYF